MISYAEGKLRSLEQNLRAGSIQNCGELRGGGGMTRHIRPFPSIKQAMPTWSRSARLLFDSLRRQPVALLSGQPAPLESYTAYPQERRLNTLPAQMQHFMSLPHPSNS
jgi:hypothetical protein